MKKEINLTKSVYDLCKEYPELKDIMAGIGFTEITRSTAMATAGRVMTIPKGAEIKGIPMERVTAVLKGFGYEITGSAVESHDVESGTTYSGYGNSEDTMTVAYGSIATGKNANSADNTEKSRHELLKSYVQRLNSGEALETVRKDFVSQFQNVDASEIMEAEQQMIASGTPLTEVQKLCDVHSALFHGTTREEQIANAEKAVEESLKNKQTRENAWKVDYSDKMEVSARLVSTNGHPLNIFTLENESLAKVIAEVRNAIEQGKDYSQQFHILRSLSIHYAKKGDLIYPLLKVRYGISGPSDVMWTVDDEIRDEINAITRVKDESLRKERLLAVLTRADEMIYKEANILFPICAKNFTETEWKQIYQEFKGYDKCLIDTIPVWEEAEKQARPEVEAAQGEVVFPSGHMTVEQLTAMLNTIPLEITFIDENNINRYYNEGWKLFKRPMMSLDREVFSCHPPKVEPMVRAIIDDFRNGKRDSVPVWMEKMGKTMLVNYMAVRDHNGKFVGTVELIQEMDFARDHFMK